MHKIKILPQPISFFEKNEWKELNRYSAETGKLVGTVTVTEDNIMNLHLSQFSNLTPYGEVFRYKLYRNPRSGTVSTVTEVLAIRVPVGLTKEQRAEARKVAQNAVEQWGYKQRMKEGLR